MVYSKRLGAIAPIASFLASVLVTILLRPWLEPRFGKWLVAVIGVAVLPVFWIIISIVNLILIDRFARSDVDERLRGYWNERLRALSEGRKSTTSVSDYVDRVVNIRTVLCKPEIVERVFEEHLRGERTSRTAAEDEKRELLAKRELSASVKVLANRWRSVDVIPTKEPRGH